MEKMSNFLEKKLYPITTWVAQNKYLQMLSQTFISLIPVIVIGAFALVFSKAPIDYTGFEEGSYWYNFFLQWSTWAESHLQVLKFVNAATLGSLSLWVTIGIGYKWAKKYNLDIFLTIIISFVNFILINSATIEGGWSTSYFGGEGLFTAVITTFLILNLYGFLIDKGIGKVNLPPTVPQALAKSISSMLPMAICFLVGCLITTLSQLAFGVTLPGIVMLIAQPFNASVDNPIAPSLIYSFSDLGYWFGIHTAATEAPFDPIMFSNLASNAAAYAKGVSAGDLPYIVNIAFRYGFTGIGGSGATFGLVLLLLRSKVDSIKSVGKLAIVPACFGINEPVVFGLPIMMNVTFFIPFILVEAINAVITYFVMAFNLLNKPIFFMGGTAPELLRSVLSNMDIRSIILWFALLALDTLIWYPFFKVYENQKLKEEKEICNS